MESNKTLTEAVELLRDKSTAQESMMFLLVRHVIDSGSVISAELADHIRSYTMPIDTPQIRELRGFYADVIGGARPLRLSLAEGGKDEPGAP